MIRNPPPKTPPKAVKAPLPKGLKPAPVNQKQLETLQQDNFTGSGGANSIVQGRPILAQTTQRG